MEKKRMLGRLALSVILIAVLVAAPMGALAASKTDIITPAKAIQAAQKKHSGSKVLDCELDYERGGYVYEIEVARSNRKTYDVKVDAKTGKVLRNKYDGKISKKYNLKNIKTSAKKAISTAQKKVKGGTFESLGVEWRNGTPYYEVEFKLSKGREKTITVNAKTGKIPSAKSKITQSKAEQIAKNAVGGGTVLKCKLDSDDGISYYDVKIKYRGTIYELEIHASTGKVIDFDIDD